MTDIIKDCPWCGGTILIKRKDFNCKIFRHSQMKDGTQTNPHYSKETHLQLLNENKIYGCGNPFKLIVEEDDVKLERCDYI